MIDTIKKKYNINIPVYEITHTRKQYVGICLSNSKKSRICLMMDNIEMMFHTKFHQLDISFEDFTEIILLHEVGHSLDNRANKTSQRLNKLYKNRKNFKKPQMYEHLTDRLILSMEQRAWDIARSKVDNRLLRDFNRIEKIFMNEYKELLKT